MHKAPTSFWVWKVKLMATVEFFKPNECVKFAAIERDSSDSISDKK